MDHQQVARRPMPMNALLDQLNEIRRRVGLMLRYLKYRFSVDQCLPKAATLSYTFLLALVPLFAVAFSVVAAFPFVDEWSERIQDFVFANYVPAASDSIQNSIQTAIDDFVAGARKLPAGSVVFLILTALLLMQEIEGTMNRLFRVRELRTRTGRFMVYWAMLSLGPILVGGSLAMSSKLLAVLGSQHIDTSTLTAFVLSVLPFVVQTMAFLLIYWIVPNRRVPFKAALSGAFFAALLFEGAKIGFVWYVTTFPTYQAVYGAMAVIPIFLLWIYVSWVVVLLGAILASGLTGMDFLRTHVEVPPAQRFGLLVRICGHLWQAQRGGTGLTEAELMRLETKVSEARLVDLLDTLRQARVVRRSETGLWMLVRDPTEVTLLDLYQAGDFVMPLDLDDLGDDDWSVSFRERLGPAGDFCREQLDVPLKKLYGREGGGAHD